MSGRGGELRVWGLQPPNPPHKFQTKENFETIHFKWSPLCSFIASNLVLSNLKVLQF